MASLSFSMALFCKELNELIKENEFKIVYCKDYGYECKSYFFTHLEEKVDDSEDKEVIEKYNKNRKNKKYLVDEIDYHKVTLHSFPALLDELNLLFEHSPKLEKGGLTTMIMIITKHGFEELIKDGNLYKIESEFNDTEKEKDEDEEVNEKKTEILLIENKESSLKMSIEKKGLKSIEEKEIKGYNWILQFVNTNALNNPMVTCESYKTLERVVDTLDLYINEWGVETFCGQLPETELTEEANKVFVESLKTLLSMNDGRLFEFYVKNKQWIICLNKVFIR